MSSKVTSTIVLKVSGKEVEHSFNGLSGIVRKFERELKKLKPGTEEFIKKSQELKEAREQFSRVKNEIDLVNGKLNQSQGFLGKFKTMAVNAGLSLGNAIVGITAFSFSQKATELLEISDAMADVQKTTGMALEEVKALWDAFDEMDTRTSKLDRLKIAEVGGRLGVPKEQMREFVQEVDKAYVALGDSFQGGLESVVDSLGKIKGLFNETKGKGYAEAINEVGSALNELAASGTASEGNISDFTLRVGALPEALRPSIDKVLGLGAAFEESGIDAQIAASGYSNFMKVAGENLEKFAYSMNMSLEEARALFNEKPEEFFLKFSEGMKNLSADETAQVFDSLKLNSLEVQKVVGAAANKTEDFRRAMDLAGVSMKEATSLTDEFNKKNNNAAAIWEKLKNMVSNFFSQNTFINMFEGVIVLVGKFAGVVNDAGDSVSTMKQKFDAVINIGKVLIATFLGYKITLMQMTLWEGNYTKAKWLGMVADKAQIAITQTKKAVTLLYAYAKNVLTGNTTRASAAMKLFNTVTKANPIGLLVGVVTAAVTAYSLFADEIDRTTESEKRLSKATQEYIGESSREISSLNQLYAAATDASKGKDAQREAVEKLQSLYPSYFGNMDKEIIMLGQAEQKYNDLKDAILASARAKGAQKIIEENTSKYLEQEEELRRKIDKSSKERDQLAKEGFGKKVVIDNSGDSMGTALWNNDTHTTNLEIAKTKYVQEKIWKKEIEDLRKKSEEENKHYLAIVEENQRKSAKYENDKNRENGGGTATNNNRTFAGGNKKEGKSNRPGVDENQKSKDAYLKTLENEKNTNKKLLEAERALEDEKLKIMQESQAKEEQEERLRHSRSLENLKEANSEILIEIAKNQAEIDKLTKQKQSSKSPEVQRQYDEAILALEKSNAKKRAIIATNDKLEKQMTETHLHNLREIEEKYKHKNYVKEWEGKLKLIEQDKAYKENELNDIETLEEAKIKLKEAEYAQLTDVELKGIKTLEEAKKVLREKIATEALKKQLEIFQKQEEALLNLIHNSGYSDEQKAKLLKDLEQLRLKMIEVKTAITGKKKKKGKENEDAEEKGREAMKQIDILGFSANEWEQTFKNLDEVEDKMKAIKMGVQALSNAFRMFSQLQQNLGDRELRRFTRNQDKKKLALLKQLNQGLITQEQYHKGLQQIEEETDNKKREIARRQAKAQRIQALAQIAVNTAQAIMSIWAQVPKFDFGISAGVLTGVVSALGAAQAAIVLSQPLPEFAEGGFTGKGSGKADRTGFKPAGVVHEQEYVTPKWMLENPIIADVVDWMESIRVGRIDLPKGYAEGGLASNEKNMGIKEVKEMEATPYDPQMMAVLSEMKELLSYLKNNGIEAYMIEDAENGKRLKRTIKLFENIENKNARKSN